MKILVMLLGGLLLSTAPLTAQVDNWTNGIIRKDGDTNNFVSVTTDATGTFFHGAWRPASGAEGFIEIGVFNGSSWTVVSSFNTSSDDNSSNLFTSLSDDVSVAVDGNGDYHVAFRGSRPNPSDPEDGRRTIRGVFYAKYDISATTWAFEEVQTGTHRNGWRNWDNPRIDVDSANNPHMSFSFSNADDRTTPPRQHFIRYASRATGSWVIEDIATTDCSEDIDDDGDNECMEMFNYDFELDSNNKAHLVYGEERGDNRDADLIYAKNSTGSFAIEVLRDLGDGDNTTGPGIGGANIEIDNNDSVYISFSELNSNDRTTLKLFTLTSGENQIISTARSKFSGGTPNAVGVSGNGRLKVIVYDGSIRAVTQVGTDEWQDQQVIGGLGAGRFIDATMNNRGQIMILYHRDLSDGVDERVQFAFGTLVDNDSTPPTTDDDSTPPVIALIGANPQTIECGASYTELGANATDNVDGYISGNIVIDASAVNTDVSGSYSVTYDVMDAAGNATQVTRTVNVVDNAPVITLTGGTVTLECNVDTYSEPGFSATDDCDGDVTGSVVTSNNINPAVPGTYVVTYNVDDAAGNAAPQMFRTVSVVDTTPPVITLSGANPQLLECSVESYNELGATASDACDGDISGRIVIDASAVNPAVPGTYIVTYNVMDAVGNAAAQVTRTVTVFDNDPPVITLTGANPQTIECNIDAYTELGATATDACDSDAAVTAAIVIDASAVNTAVLGSYNVTYNVSDLSGNGATQVMRTINVVDTTPPTIALTGANPQTIECNTGSYTELGAIATDACDLSLGAVVIDASAVNTAVPGSYTVTYNIADASGNAATQMTRTVNVVDTTDPVITLKGANPQVIECPAAYTELGATATDACDLDLGAVVIDASAVNTAVPGSYTVTYNIVDAAGNAATQVTRTVNVVDTTDPVVAITSPATGDKFYPGASVDVAYTAVDACDPAPTVVVTPGDPTLLPSTGLPQDIVITVQATDASGNVGSASVTVLVQEPQDFAGDLIVEVNQLVTNGALNGGQGNSLVRKLEHIINKIDEGKINSALGQLQAFTNQVTDFIANGVLTSADGQPLIDGAQAIVDFLNSGSPKIVRVPEGFDLGAATPNPFNPSTEISYQLPEAGSILLAVYNMNGQLVRVLSQGHQSAGYYTVTWDGRNHVGQTVSSGVYLYRLSSGKFSLTNRMLLLK